MKIISAYEDREGATVTVLFPETGVTEAVHNMAKLLSFVSSDEGYTAEDAGTQSGPAQPEAISTEIVDVGSQTMDVPVRTRHRRTKAEREAAKAAENPTSPASAPDADTSGSTEPGTRRRRASAPAPDPMPITDAELSKAASHAAQELVQLGDDGPALVTLVLQDFKVATVGELVGPDREKFIHELNKEVEAAKAEKAA